MKPFQLSRDLLNMRGQFYPTGHIVAMVPGEDAARQACKAIVDAGLSEDEISLLPPQTVLQEVVRTVGSADIPLPSPGTEADTVRRFADYASDGHWMLLVHAPKSRETDLVMKALAGHPVAYAEKYRALVIEDLAG